MLVRTALVAPLLSSGLFGWSKQGHMVAASIAYRQLTQEQREYFTDILGNHPNYDVWVQDHQTWPTAGWFWRGTGWPLG